MPILTATAAATPPSSGGWLVSPDGRELPLRAAALRVDAAGGLARSVLEQRFANAYDEPLRLRYALPLPADGAVAGFRFRIGDRTVAGEVRSREAARDTYEAALVDGRTAALVEQERPNLFTQELGNVPPHTDVVVEITVDQPLAWLADGRWEYRFPTVVAPRYLGAPGRIDDAARVAVPVAGGDLPARLTLALAVRDELSEGAAPESPSHALRVDPHARGFEASLVAAAGVPLDRDVVVRWAVAGLEPGVRLEVARPPAGHPRAGEAFGVLAIVPPAPEAQPAPVARDLIVLLDVSGSMSGAPLDQAVALASAVVGSLGAEDTLEMIAFANRPVRWRSAPARMTPATRAAAQTWLGQLEADGGTEMAEGVREALAPLRGDAQRQVLLLTDGLVGFEEEIVRQVVDHLPPVCDREPVGTRVHAVGVGAAVNRALTQAVARAGRGGEVVVDVDEPIDAAAERLLALTTAPLAVGLQIDGAAVRSVAPRRLPDVMAGMPCLAAVALDPAGGEVVVRGRFGGVAWARRVTAPAVECGAGAPAVIGRWAREVVADAEMRLAGGGPDEESFIEGIGLEFAIATRRTSWVAVSDEATVDPTRATRRVEMPQALPVGMSAKTLGLGGGRVVFRQAALRADMTTLVEQFGVVGRFRHTALGRPRGPQRTRVRGRVVLAAPGRLVIEFEVGAHELSWHPAPTVVLRAADEVDGIAAGVVILASTAPGRIEPGRTVRLVLDLGDAAPPVPYAVEVRIGGGASDVLLIEIEAP